MRHREIEANGLSLHFVEQGDGSVQSFRAISDGRHVGAWPGVLHATNRGANAGDDIACNTSDRGVRAGQCGPESSDTTPRHEIACKTLPCDFTRFGLPPLIARLGEAVIWF